MECSSCRAYMLFSTPTSKGGLSYQGCALWRKKLKEVWFTICHENGIYQDLLNTSESSDDNTNVVNAPQEPFVVKQDPGENSSQSPPQINHNCCYECGDSLDGIFCQRCTCKSCGKGAHYGYNCPPKVPVIFNPEPCQNQTIKELPQTLPNVHPTCYSGVEDSFTYDSNHNFVDDSSNPPPQPPTYTYEFCGNNAYYDHDCPPQVPFTYYYHKQNSCYDPNSFGFDQFKTPQYTVNHLIFNDQNDILNSQNELFNSQNKFMVQLTSIRDMVGQYIQKKEEEKRIEEEQGAKARYWKIPVCYDDDDDEERSISLKDTIISGLPPCVAITPNSPKTNSLIIEDKHLSTISETESDEFIKSSVKNLVPTPSESEDECECDMSDCDDSQTTNFSTYSNPLFDDSTSSNDESSHEEEIHEMSFITYSNPLFDLGKEIISSEFNPIHNEDPDSTSKNDRFDTESYLLESLVNHDTLTVSPPKIDFLFDEFAGELTQLQRVQKIRKSAKDPKDCYQWST
ncbi:hypothetical protein Tco_0899563 [Tanacetum coccineum]